MSPWAISAEREGGIFSSFLALAVGDRRDAVHEIRLAFSLFFYLDLHVHRLGGGGVSSCKLHVLGRSLGAAPKGRGRVGVHAWMACKVCQWHGLLVLLCFLRRCSCRAFHLSRVGARAVIYVARDSKSHLTRQRPSCLSKSLVVCACIAEAAPDELPIAWFSSPNPPPRRCPAPAPTSSPATANIPPTNPPSKALNLPVDVHSSRPDAHAPLGQQALEFAHSRSQSLVFSTHSLDLAPRGRQLTRLVCTAAAADTSAARSAHGSTTLSRRCGGGA